MTQRFETFATLPPLSNAQIMEQASYLLTEGMVVSIDYAESPSAADFYWQPWPLDAVIKHDAAGHAKPLSAENITAQLDACANRHPYAFVRLSGYCPRTRNTALSFIAKTPVEGQVI